MQRRLGVITITAVLTAACNPGPGSAQGGVGTDGSPDARSAPTRPAAPKLTLPEGTALPVVLETTVSSATSNEGDTVLATLAEDVKLGERVVAAAGSEVKGRITAAVRSGKVKGRARLAFRFDRLVSKGKEITIVTTPIDITASNTKKKDAAIIGGATAGGAILGAVIDGKKGAAIGAGVGAAGGTGAVLATRGREVELRQGQSLTVKLSDPAVL